MVLEHIPDEALPFVQSLGTTAFFLSFSSKSDHASLAVFVCKSSSMKLKTRWKAAEDLVRGIAEQCATLGRDGVSVCFFGSQSRTSAGMLPAYYRYESVATQEEVNRLFTLPECQPSGTRDLTQ